MGCQLRQNLSPLSGKFHMQGAESRYCVQSGVEGRDVRAGRSDHLGLYRVYCCLLRSYEETGVPGIQQRPCTIEQLITVDGGMACIMIVRWVFPCMRPVVQPKLNPRGSVS